MMNFTRDEIILMILYSPGRQYGRTGLIKELKNVLDELEPRDKWLKKHLPMLLDKLNQMTDTEFDNLDLDIE